MDQKQQGMMTAQQKSLKLPHQLHAAVYSADHGVNAGIAPEIGTGTRWV